MRGTYSIICVYTRVHPNPLPPLTYAGRQQLRRVSTELPCLLKAALQHYKQTKVCRPETLCLRDGYVYTTLRGRPVV